MDRNSAIGLTLIAALLMAYFYWFSPQPEQPKENVKTTQTVASPGEITSPAEKSIADDSVLTATYGDLSASFKGEEKVTEIETADLKIKFSSKGGLIQNLELKNYKTYSGKPLTLIDPKSNIFKLLTKYKGEEIDLYSLYYTTDSKKNGDTTLLTYTLRLSDGSELKQIYSVPDKGYEIGYKISGRGISNQLSDQLSLQTENFLRPLEKDIADSRVQTTIIYNNGGSVSELNGRSDSPEKEVFGPGLKWVSLKQKFFLVSLISEKGFNSGEIETSLNKSDTSVVKRANVKLAFASKDLSDGTANFKLLCN